MTTVLIWLGSGFAFGAGTIVGMRLFSVPSKVAKDRAQYELDSLTAMQERNALDREKVELIERVASALEGMELELRNRN